MSESLMGQDRILVLKDGEEIDVINHVSVATFHYVNSVNGHETFTPQITKGDSDEPVEYVTERIAEYLDIEWGIDVEDHGITVINPHDDGVDIL